MLMHDAHADWAWPLSLQHRERPDRMPLMRQVPYSLSLELDGAEHADLEEEGAEPAGVALSMNVSAGGMLVIMNGAPKPPRVLRVHVPTPVSGVAAPTLAEVRWLRKLPFPAPHSLYLVGLKFIV